MQTVVLGALYLHRLLGPLTQYLKEAIRSATMQGSLLVAAPANVQVCIVDTLRGPTYVITHRRRRLSSETNQHKGNQSYPLRFYVALARARPSTWV